MIAEKIEEAFSAIISGYDIYRWLFHINELTMFGSRRSPSGTAPCTSWAEAVKAGYVLSGPSISTMFRGQEMGIRAAGNKDPEHV